MLFAMLAGTALATQAVASTMGGTYEGQSYGVSFLHPNGTYPWLTEGYNDIVVQTVQTLICCPPLPPIAWTVRNRQGLLDNVGGDVVLEGSTNFSAPRNPHADLPPGRGYYLVAALATNRSQNFGQSEDFEVQEGSREEPTGEPEWPTSTPSPDGTPGPSSGKTTGGPLTSTVHPLGTADPTSSTLTLTSANGGAGSGSNAASHSTTTSAAQAENASASASQSAASHGSLARNPVPVVAALVAGTLLALFY